MKHILILKSILAMLFFVSCNQSASEAHKSGSIDTIPLDYAKGFTVVETSHGYQLEVKNPWQHANNVSYTYNLAYQSAKQQIQIPVKRVVCLSTTHVSYLDNLGELESLVGMSNPRFATNEKLQQRIKDGKVLDTGYDRALNYEQILELKPDVIFAFSIGAEVAQIVQKFADWGIPVIVVPEYLETHPLAMAEWIKFFGAFYNKFGESEEIFTSIKSSYKSYSALVSQVTKQPNVMTGLPWKGVWYVPGGNSYMAKYIKDAGGRYLWGNVDKKENLSLSIEEVFSKGQKAHVWLQPSMANSLEELLQNDTRVSKLPVFQAGEVYNNNRIMSANGGNDFYESATMKPHLVLRDLIKIFHPNFLVDSSFTYYHQLK